MSAVTRPSGLNRQSTMRGGRWCICRVRDWVMYLKHGRSSSQCAKMIAPPKGVFVKQDLSFCNARCLSHWSSFSGDNVKLQGCSCL